MGFFDTSNLRNLLDEIKSIYTSYKLPWVIGYSGGKDSTTTLQLIWKALAELKPEERTNHVYVITTDTLVETPVIVDFINTNFSKIEEEAKKQGLPISAHKLSPAIPDTFWVNLIGRGYPAPNSGFRWCTDRLKIKPSNTFILEKVAEHGEVILALGMRKGESHNRDKVIKNYEVQGYKLSRHSQLPGSWVYMPIEAFTSDDVWTYLIQNESPWGGDNRSLASLYRSAQSGECPLVIDDTTESCGKSRFGCWTCTVVAKDKSMEAMIDSGEEWMAPLLDFRDWLSATQNPEVKAEQREFKGRDGRIKVSDNGTLRYRTYKIEFSRAMLKRLLETQAEVQQHDSSLELISLDELKEIRRLWVSERQDWNDSLPGIYEEVTNKKFSKEFSDIVTPSIDDQLILTEIAEANEVPPKLIQKLIDAEWQSHGLFRRSSIYNKIDKIFSEDWRSWEEVEVEIQQKKEETVNEN